MFAAARILPWFIRERWRGGSGRFAHTGVHSRQPLPRRAVVSRVEVYPDITAVQLVRRSQSGTGAAERIEDHVARPGESADEGFQGFDRLLCRVQAVEGKGEVKHIGHGRRGECRPALRQQIGAFMAVREVPAAGCVLLAENDVADGGESGCAPRRHESFLITIAVEADAQAVGFQDAVDPHGQLPPVNGFWSLTLYNEHHFFHPNPLKRYSLGTKNRNLQTSPDGSLTLYAGANSPGKEKETNWLPAPTRVNPLVETRGNVHDCRSV